MTPAPGNYPPDQQITLYVSGGGIQVPNVVNQTAAEAQAILQQDGFNVQTNSTPAPATRWSSRGRSTTRTRPRTRSSPRAR